MQATIDRVRWEPVPGKDGAFRLIDKETGKQVDMFGLPIEKDATGA